MSLLPGALGGRPRVLRLNPIAACFERGVHGLPGDGAEAGQRDDVDHVTAPLSAHRVERGDGAVDRAEGVDLEHQSPRALVLLPGGTGDEDAGVVDPDVEAAGELDDLVAGGLDLVRSRTSTARGTARVAELRCAAARWPRRRR